MAFLDLRRLIYLLPGLLLLLGHSSMITYGLPTIAGNDMVTLKSSIEYRPRFTDTCSVSSALGSITERSMCTVRHSRNNKLKILHELEAPSMSIKNVHPALLYETRFGYHLRQSPSFTLAMKFFTCALLFSSFLLISAVPQSQSTDTDWKYSVGWNGTVSAPTSIGIPVNTTGQDSSLSADGHVGGVYICEDEDWEGTCGYAVQPLGECISLGTNWYRQISSIGPDPGNKIVGYAEANCQEDIWGTFTVSFPGSDAMGDWNDLLGSFYVYST